MDLAVVAAIVAFVLAAAYVFTKITMQLGLAKGFIAVMILADIYAVMFMLLGIDRPLFIVSTRLGSITVTALELFLLVKIPLTVYSIIKMKALQQVFG